MRRRGLTIAAVLAASVAGLAGCGSGSGAGATPGLSGLPLVSGIKVLSSVRRCDRGANAYCAIQLVVSGGRYADSTALLHAERDHLKALGWSPANADTGDEQAADSPHHRLHLLLATAALDLKDLDLGWIQRAPVIGRTLSQTMFDRAPALSLMLETGSS